MSNNVIDLELYRGKWKTLFESFDDDVDLQVHADLYHKELEVTAVNSDGESFAVFLNVDDARALYERLREVFEPVSGDKR